MVHVSTAPPVAPMPLADAPHSLATEYAPPLIDTSHTQEYVEVPEEGIVPVTVNVVEAEGPVELGVGAAGAVNPGATVTTAEAVDVAVSGFDALSVTFSSKVYVLPPVNVLAAILQVSVAPPIAPLPEFNAHWVAGP